MKYNVLDITDIESVQNNSRIMSSKCLTSHFFWIKEWWNSFCEINTDQVGRNKKIHFIVVENCDDFLIMPLVSLSRNVKGCSIKFVEFIAQQWGGAEYEIIYSSSQVSELLSIAVKYVRENIKHDIFFLKYILEYSPLRKHSALFLHGVSPFIDLTNYESFDDYKNKRYTKKLKQNIRTAYNKAKKNNVEILVTKEKVDESNISIIKRLSQSKLVDGKSCVYNDFNKYNFYFNIFKKFNADVLFIRLNGLPVAYRVNVILNNKKYCIDASYSRDFRQYDLGVLSVNANIEDSFRKNIKTHSMGPGSDWYKYRFIDNIEKLYSFINRGNTLKSFFIYPVFLFFIKKKAKAINLLTSM